MSSPAWYKIVALILVMILLLGECHRNSSCSSRSFCQSFFRTIPHEKMLSTGYWEACLKKYINFFFREATVKLTVNIGNVPVAVDLTTARLPSARETASFFRINPNTLTSSNPAMASSSASITKSTSSWRQHPRVTWTQECWLRRQFEGLQRGLFRCRQCVWVNGKRWWNGYRRESQTVEKEWW